MTRTAPEPGSAVRVSIEQTAIEVVPGGDEVNVAAHVYNVSPIVDAYRVWAPEPPSWLTTTSAEVRLLPNGNELTQLILRIPVGTLAPAGGFRLLIRVQSVAHPEVIVDEYLDLTVPAVVTPLELRLEPSIVRVKNDEAGRLRITIDNSGGNQDRRVTLAGRDPEEVVRYFFSPGVVEVPAGGTAGAGLRVEGPQPEPGEQATRQLTVTANDGRSEVEAVATFIQVSAAEVPMSLRVEPSLVRVRDGAAGQLDISIDNRRGSRTRRVFLGGRDSERVVHFAFSPPSIDVLSGEVGRARLKIEAPPPPPGQESTRTITVLASSEGLADLEAPATFVQATAAAPVDVPVVLRLDPSVVRVRDTRVGQLEAILDNRSGTRVRRVFLTGRDPERLVRFTFSPPSLDVLPGDIGRARVRMEAPLPDPGSGGHPPGHRGRRRREQGNRGERHLRPSHLTETGGNPGGAETRPQPAAGPGQPVRTVPGHRRQPAGHPAPAGHPLPAPIRNGRWDSRSGRRWWRSARARSHGPTPGSTATRRNPAGRSPGRSRCRRPTAGWRWRPTAPSSRPHPRYRPMNR